LIGKWKMRIEGIKSWWGLLEVRTRNDWRKTGESSSVFYWDLKLNCKEKGGNSGNHSNFVISINLKLQWSLYTTLPRLPYIWIGSNIDWLKIWETVYQIAIYFSKRSMKDFLLEVIVHLESYMYIHKNMAIENLRCLFSGLAIQWLKIHLLIELLGFGNIEGNLSWFKSRSSPIHQTFHRISLKSTEFHEWISQISWSGDISIITRIRMSESLVIEIEQANKEVYTSVPVLLNLFRVSRIQCRTENWRRSLDSEEQRWKPIKFHEKITIHCFQSSP
jgi:hypothetical protein